MLCSFANIVGCAEPCRTRGIIGKRPDIRPRYGPLPFTCRVHSSVPRNVFVPHTARMTHRTATRHWQDVLHNYSSRRRKQSISDQVGYEAFCGTIDNNQALITRSSDGQRLSEECERRPVSFRSNIRQKSATVKNSVLTVVLYKFQHNLFALKTNIL